ncbi:hypothetical protein QYF36_021840 [Acer negundo]|nr:hypothetical protein QYF36_021840 [Acer negundo]
MLASNTNFSYLKSEIRPIPLIRARSKVTTCQNPGIFGIKTEDQEGLDKTRRLGEWHSNRSRRGRRDVTRERLRQARSNVAALEKPWSDEMGEMG